ncbi:hypothetical protein HYZ97_01175, partial [Candidatus Pacearchaeota archaeon]|nr:hypothetical protein [Candidatus Pacearchaeota archaeon]
TGVFSFEDAYAYAFSWFKDESYGLIEEKYSEKVSGTARDINFEWKGSKQLSDYFKIEISFKTEVVGLTDVEVEIDGKKKKSNKGKIMIDIKGALVRDPDSKWDVSPFYRFIRDLYNKYIIPGRGEAMEGLVMSDVQNLKEKLKLFFELSGKR